MAEKALEAIFELKPEWLDQIEFDGEHNLSPPHLVPSSQLTQPL